MPNKELKLFMNCYGDQIKYYLNSLTNVLDKFKSIDVITTYQNLENDHVLNSFKTCDYLICNNIKSYPHLSPEQIRKIVKPTCKIIIIEYFRFNGFHPLQYMTHTNNLLWIYDDSFKNTDSYEQYVNYLVDPEIITQRFDQALVKLKYMDEMSDIKVYDFFVENYKQKLLFRDPNHVTDYFMKHIIKQLLPKLDLEVDNKIVDGISELYVYGFKFRYTPILNCVKETLSLDFDDSMINFFNNKISREDFYKIIIHDKDQNMKTIEQKTESLAQ